MHTHIQCVREEYFEFEDLFFKKNSLMCVSLTERFHVLIVFFLHTCKLVQLLRIAYIKELLVLPNMAQGFYKDLS